MCRRRRRLRVAVASHGVRPDVVIGSGGWRRPELAAAEEAGVPARGAPHVARAGPGVHVHAAQAEAHLVGEEELEHVQERPHEVAPRVRPVPAYVCMHACIHITANSFGNVHIE